MLTCTGRYRKTATGKRLLMGAAQTWMRQSVKGCLRLPVMRGFTNSVARLFAYCIHITLRLMRQTQKKSWRCMIVNGQMKRYREYLKTMPEPIQLKDIRQDMDLRGLLDYAKRKGKKVIELSEQERMSFLR